VLPHLCLLLVVVSTVDIVSTATMRVQQDIEETSQTSFVLLLMTRDWRDSCDSRLLQPRSLP
jgi:hypothetical protein